MKKTFEVQSSVHEIKICSEVAYNIACDTATALKESCRNHWVNHPNSFLENEKERIDRMKMFFDLSNYGRLFEEELNSMKKIVFPDAK